MATRSSTERNDTVSFGYRQLSRSSGQTSGASLPFEPRFWPQWQTPGVGQDATRRTEAAPVPDGNARPGPQWSELEAAILAATLRQLQEHGYDRLTLDAVAVEARSSKSTIHRRWSTKAQLVVAAFIEGTRASETPPRTGSLRGDLISIGTAMRELACQHSSTMRAVLNELTHNPDLSLAFYQGFVHKRIALYDDVIAAAIDRGEIVASDVDPEFNDLLGGYLVFRATISEAPPDERTVQVLVDDYLMPRLTRSRP